MADTDITKAQLDVELGRVKTYVRASNWKSARLELACARATFAGIAQSLASGGKSLAYRQVLDDLSKLIDEAKTETNASTDSECRIIRSRLGFGT